MVISQVMQAVAGGISASSGPGANSAQMAVVPPQLRSTTAALHEVLYYVPPTPANTFLCLFLCLIRSVQLFCFGIWTAVAVADY